MKTYTAFKQGKLFELTQQGNRIVSFITDPKHPLDTKRVVMGEGSIVLWDKLVKDLEETA